MTLNARSRVSTVLNTAIFILMVFGAFIMFTGIKITHGTGVPLESTRLGMLKFFTVDSNIFMGLTALVFAVRKKRTTALVVLKFIATVSVSLTFLIVFGYFWLVLRIPVLSLLQNSNLFFHLIIPVFSIVTFVCFERTDRIKFRHTFLGLIPTFLYAVFYAVNVFSHMTDGVVPKKYDWYGFMNAGLYAGIAVIPGMLILTYVICVILWLSNRKRH